MNAIHFAREGNSGANRLLLIAIAANAGHTLAFDVITRERMVAVSVAAHTGDPTKAGLALRVAVHPRHSGTASA